MAQDTYLGADWCSRCHWHRLLPSGLSFVNAGRRFATRTLVPHCRADGGEFSMYRRNLIVGVIASACFGIRRARAWHSKSSARMLRLMDKLLRPQLDPVRKR